MNRLVAVLLGVSLMAGNLFAVEGKIVVEGSTTVLPIAQAAAESFMGQNKDANISVRGGGVAGPLRFRNVERGRLPR